METYNERFFNYVVYLSLALMCSMAVAFFIQTIVTWYELVS